MANEQELLVRIEGSAKGYQDALSKAQKRTKDFEKTLTTVAKVSGAAFIGLALAVGLATKEFAKFEKALVGVGKTTNLSGKELDKFGKGVVGLAKTIPVATNDLLGFAQIAGQLGVTGSKNLLNFTEVIAKLGVATDLSGEQAATSLTRILNVTNEGVESIGTLAAVIVDLGNNFAASESEIVKVATEVARSTSVFKLSSGEVAALAVAMKSLGIQAQLGGSAVGRTFREIDKAIRKGGKTFELLQKLTGLTGEALIQTFEKDAVVVFQKFVEGLDKVGKGTGSVSATLEEFGLKGDEIAKVIPVLAQRSDLLAQALERQAKQTKNATALNEEAARAFGTLESKATLLTNATTRLTVKFGAAFAPVVEKVIKTLTILVNKLGDLSSTTILVISRIALFLLSLTGLVAGAAIAGLAFIKLRAIFLAITVVLKGARIAAIGFTAALTGGLSLILAFLPEIIAGFKALFNALERSGESKSLEETTKRLDGLKRKREELQKSVDNAESTDKARAQAELDRVDKLITKNEELKKSFEGIRKSIGGKPDAAAEAAILQNQKLLKVRERLQTVRDNASSTDKARAQAELDRVNSIIAKNDNLISKLLEVRGIREQPDVITKEAFAAEGGGGVAEDPIIAQKLKEAAALEKIEKESNERFREIRSNQVEISKLQAEKESSDRENAKKKNLTSLEKFDSDAIARNLDLRNKELSLLQGIDDRKSQNAKISAQNTVSEKEAIQKNGNDQEISLLQEQLVALREFQDTQREENLEKRQEEIEEDRERKIEEFEVGLELDAELQQLTVEQRALFREQDVETIKAGIASDRELKRQNAIEEIKSNQGRRKRFLKIEQKHGKTVAVLDAALNNQKVDGFRRTSGDLAALQKSSNATQRAIGKRAAQVSIAIDTARGAISAYTSLAGIPIVGPALGLLAAISLTAFGIERLAEVNRAQQGGVVPGAGIGDRVPILAEPGEIIIPKALTPTFRDQFALDETDRPDNESSARTTIVQIQGDIIGTEEFVEESIIPLIRNAIENKNADIGIEGV